MKELLKIGQVILVIGLIVIIATIIDVIVIPFLIFISSDPITLSIMIGLSIMVVGAFIVGFADAEEVKY